VEKPSGGSVSDHHYVLLHAACETSKAHQEHWIVACSSVLSLRSFTAFRLLAFSWMCTTGIIYGWFFSESNTWSTSPPVVFLTEWGFVAACFYMGLGTWASITMLLDELAANTNSVEEAFSRAEQASDAEKGEGLYLRATAILFHIAVVLEPAIVVGYWLLVYPVDPHCSFPNCYTVHGAGALFVVIDGFTNQLELEVKRIHWPLGYAAAWFLSQVAWVYTGHAPDYSVLTLRDIQSIYVAVGGFVSLALVFVLERALFNGVKKAGAKVIREGIRGRFDSAPEATF